MQTLTPGHPETHEIRAIALLDEARELLKSPDYTLAMNGRFPQVVHVPKHGRHTHDQVALVLPPCLAERVQRMAARLGRSAEKTKTTPPKPRPQPAREDQARAGSSPQWSEIEERLLHGLYPRAPMEIVLRALPGRTYHAIRKAAHRRGIERTVGTQVRRRYVVYSVGDETRGA